MSRNRPQTAKIGLNSINSKQQTIKQPQKLNPQQQFKNIVQNKFIQSGATVFNDLYKNGKKNTKNTQQYDSTSHISSEMSINEFENKKAQLLKKKQNRQSSFQFDDKLFIGYVDKQSREIKKQFSRNKILINQQQYGYPQVQDYQEEQQDQNINNQEKEFQHINENGLVHLDPKHPYQTNLKRYVYQYFQIPLKKKEKPVILQLKKIDGPDKFNLKSFVSSNNRNPNILNAESQYVNIMKIKHNEDSSSLYFENNFLYISIYSDQELVLNCSLRYGFNQKPDQQDEDLVKPISGEEKIQQFLDEKNKQKRTSLQMMDNESLKDTVDMIFQKRKDKVMNKSTGLNYLKENKKMKVYKPFNKENIRHTKKIQSQCHIQSVINRQQDMYSYKKQMNLEMYNQKQDKLNTMSRDSYYSHLISTRALSAKITRGGQLLRIQSAKTVNNQQASFFSSNSKFPQKQQKFNNFTEKNKTIDDDFSDQSFQIKNPFSTAENTQYNTGQSQFQNLNSGRGQSAKINYNFENNINVQDNYQAEYLENQKKNQINNNNQNQRPQTASQNNISQKKLNRPQTAKINIINNRNQSAQTQINQHDKDIILDEEDDEEIEDEFI